MTRREQPDPPDLPRLPPRRWITPTEVADYLRLDRSTVYRMLRSGTLPSVRLGGSVRVPRKELLRVLGGSTSED